MTDLDKPAFAKAMATLALALREKEPDAAQMRVYFKALSPLEIEFIVLAADRLASSSQWFPKTSEWHTEARRIEADRAFQLSEVIRKRRIRGLSPLCGECLDTKFVLHPESNRYRRCAACPELRRLEILGRRPLPELPESDAIADPTQESTALALASKHVKGMR